MRYERNGAPVPQAERTFMYWRAQYFKVLVQKSAFAILFVTMLALGYDFMQPSVEVWLRVRVRSASACLTVGMITFVHSSLWYHRMCPRVLLFFSFLYACLLISYAITLKDISYGIHICFMFWVLNYLPVPAIDGIIVAFLHTAGYTLGAMVHGGASKSSGASKSQELEKCGLVCVFLVIMGSGAVNRELALRRNHINLKVSRNQARVLKLEEAAQNALLGSMLPQEMLHELKANAQPNESKLVAEHPEVSVLFCKLDNFTRRTKGMRASVVVGLLNEIWTALDKVVDFHGVYKVETVGEVYMVVSGCPRLVSNHAHLATNTALGMQDTLVQLQQDAWWRESRLPSFQLKMGVHTGPVVAGLLGLRFKLVGDTVNTASRMCSTSQAGAIQLSTTTHAKLMGCRYDYQSNTINVAHTTAYHVKKRKPIEVKGKGLMQTYFVRSSTQMVPWEEPIYSLEQGLQNRNELTPQQFR
jgi:class 3 adenylate cyclase